MIELKGKYTDCKIFTDYVEPTALSQVYGFINDESFKGLKTRFMPDIHAGCGAVIGTTVELGKRIIPNIVGVDIGCGMLSYKLEAKEVNLEELDKFIHHSIPAGFSVNQRDALIDYNLSDAIVRVCKEINIETGRALRSVGTLGGGNHFIELGRDEEGSLWLTVHTGSRNFGLQIAKYHQKVSENIAKGGLTKDQLKDQIIILKDQYSGKKLQEEIQKLKEPKGGKVTKGLEYLEDTEANIYLNHMKVAQLYASTSRQIILDKIVGHLGTNILEKVQSVHNYIDFRDGVVRKGAISAHRGQLVVIPWNMRDGLIIGEGLGNKDWNNSAPHGAGRTMSRSKAKQEVLLEEFEESMEGIYSTCVNEATIDESPMAYKDYKEVEKHLSKSVKVLHRVKPIYNFKG